MIRKAKAEWRGTGKDGTGGLTSDSGVLSGTPYSFKTRFQGEKGTNPEELIAAAHAGCFTMALAFQLQTAGFTPTLLETEAAVSLDQDGAVSRSASRPSLWWPRCRTSTRRPSTSWPRRPRRVAPSPSCSTPR